MNPIAENVKTAASILREMARNPTPSVMGLRCLAEKLDWISEQVAEVEEQAKLVAAAPAMLEALQTLADNPYDINRERIARDAIKLATKGAMQ